MNDPAAALSPAPIVIRDGDKEVKVYGVAAMMIRMIAEQTKFVNAPYNAGVLHFHFSGSQQSANMKTDLSVQMT